MGDSIDIDVLADAVTTRVVRAIEPKLDALATLPIRIAALEKEKTEREDDAKERAKRPGTIVMAGLVAAAGAVGGAVSKFLPVLFLLILSGCGSPFRAPPTPVLPTVDVKAQIQKVEAERDEARQGMSRERQRAESEQDLADRLKIEAAAAQKRANAAERAATKAEREAQIAPIRTSIRWLMGICVLVMAAGVALAIAARFLSLGFAASIPAAGAAGAAGSLALLLATSWALDHLFILGSGAAVLALALAVAWYLHNQKVKAVVKTFGDTGTEALDTLERLGHTAEAASIKAKAVISQEKAKIRKQVDAVRGRFGLRSKQKSATK